MISGSVTIDYAYDGWGNLIQESSNGVTTEFVLDERGALPTILGEVRSDGTERLYAYGPEGFAAQMSVGGAIEYPLVDGLGSVRHLTDGAGNVLLSRSYDAFGNLRHSSGAGVTRLGFTGELQDLMTGLVYLRARHYHPVLGRFLQRDSFAGFQQRPQSLNRYAYTENNPVNHRDPSGHFIDTLLDVGFIAYDIHRIIQDNILRDCDNLGENVLSLVLDVGGMLVPFVTGAGMAGRAISHADDLGDLLRHADDLPGLPRFADDAVRRAGKTLNSSNSLLGVEKAGSELVEAIGKKGRVIEFATPGSEGLRYLDYIGAEANVGGEDLMHILLREAPSKAALLEEFLHGTQQKLGIIERLGISGAERHVKDFMIRHRQLLGLSDEDVRILEILKDAGL